MCPDFRPASTKQKKEIASVVDNLKKIKKTTPPGQAKKKKKHNAWSFLTKAVQTAGSVVPAILPFLFGNPQGHVASQAMFAAKPELARQVPGAMSARPPGGMVAAAAGPPTAVAAPMGNLVGLKTYKATRADSRGNVQAVRMAGCDYIGSLPSTAFNAGDVMFQCWITPANPLLDGTIFASRCRDFQKWKLRNMTLCVTPTCSTGTSGAAVVGASSDPLFPLNNMSGVGRIQTCATQEGAEEFQIWSTGMGSVPPSSASLFMDNNARPISESDAGIMFVVAATALSATSYGDMYLIWDVECEDPSVSPVPNAGASAQLIGATFTNGSTTVPVLTYSTYVSFLGPGKFVLAQTCTAGGTAITANCLVGLAPGDYWVVLRFGGTAVLGSIILTDEAKADGATALLAVQGGGGGTTIVQYQAAFSIGPSSQVNQPHIYFSSTSTAITSATMYCFMINEGLYTTDPVGPAPVGVGDGLHPLTLAERRKRKNDAVFAVSYEGRSARQSMLLGRVTAFMNRCLAESSSSSDPPAAARPAASSSYLLFPDQRGTRGNH